MLKQIEFYWGFFQLELMLMGEILIRRLISNSKTLFFVFLFNKKKKERKKILISLYTLKRCW